MVRFYQRKLKILHEFFDPKHTTSLQDLHILNQPDVVHYCFGLTSSSDFPRTRAYLRASTVGNGHVVMRLYCKRCFICCKTHYAYNCVILYTWCDVFHLKESGEAGSCSGTTEAAPKRKRAGRRTWCLRPWIERFAWKMLIKSLHCSRNAILVLNCSCEFYSATFHL